MKNRSGFTLLELLVVIAIIGILATIGVPKFGYWLNEYRLKKAVRELVSNMNLARGSAIKENKEWAVVFEPGNDRYHVCSDDGADDSWSTMDDNTVVQSVRLSEYKGGVEFGAQSATKAANTSGSAIPSDYVRFGSSSNYASFKPNGMLGLAGYVYMTNDNKTDFAVGGMMSGVVVLKRWEGSEWSE